MGRCLGYSVHDSTRFVELTTPTVQLSDHISKHGVISGCNLAIESSASQIIRIRRRCMRLVRHKERLKQVIRGSMVQRKKWFAASHL